MRVFQGLLTALAATSYTLATPLLGTTSTAVSVDRDPSLISSGSLVIHVVRTDDLLTDATPSSEVSLLLERLTHLVLRIELDKEDGTLRINDGRVDLAGKVAIARAEALMLPKEDMMVEGKMMSVEAMKGLAESLPVGIVKTEIIVQEDASVEPLLVKSEDNGDMVVSIKSYDVFVKIIEVEALELTHSTTLFIPILKLQLSLQGDDGKPISMKAFAFPPTHNNADVISKVDERVEGVNNGPQRLDGGRPRPGPPHHDRPERPHRRPQHGDDHDHPHGRPHHRHPSPWHGRHGHDHEHHRGPPAFVRWIAEKLGFAPSAPHHGEYREIDADESFPTVLQTHRRPGPLAFEREALFGPQPVGPHRHGKGSHGKGPHHGQRRRFACKVRHFFRSVAFSLQGLAGSYGLFIILGIKLMSLGAMLFVLVKRGKEHVRQRREGAVRLEDEEEAVTAVVATDAKVNEKAGLEVIVEEK